MVEAPSRSFVSSKLRSGGEGSSGLFRFCSVELAVSDATACEKEGVMVRVAAVNLLEQELGIASSPLTSL